MEDIVIPLRHTGFQLQRGYKVDYFEDVNNEYTKGYLSQLGVTNPTTRSLKRLVEKHAPVASRRIQAAWTDYGKVADTLRIMPRPRSAAAQDASPSKRRQQPRGRDGNAETLAREAARRGVAAAKEAKEARAVEDSSAAAAATTGVEAEGLAGRDRKRGGSAASLTPSESRDVARAFRENIRHQTVMPPDVPLLMRPPLGSGAEAARAEEVARLHQAWANQPGPQLTPVEEAWMQELELMRKGGRQVSTGAELISQEAKLLNERRELGELQRKYIVPFCFAGPLSRSNAPQKRSQNGSVWVLEKEGPTMDIHPDMRKAVAKPISLKLEAIREELLTYSKKTLPFALLTTKDDPRLVSKVNEHLQNPDFARLIGLMAHLLYWMVLGPLRSSAGSSSNNNHDHNNKNDECESNRSSSSSSKRSSHDHHHQDRGDEGSANSRQSSRSTSTSSNSNGHSNSNSNNSNNSNGHSNNSNSSAKSSNYNVNEGSESSHSDTGFVDLSNGLPEETKQSIIITILGLWRGFETSEKSSNLFPSKVGSFTSFVLPVLLLMVKRGIERVFLFEYPNVFDTEAPSALLDVRHEMGAQLVMHINILCRNLLDPDNIFSHFGALDTSPEAVRLWQRLKLFQASRGMALPARLHSEAHRPTQLVRTLLEVGGACEWSDAWGDGNGELDGDGEEGPHVAAKMGPADARTRKALFKCHSEGALASTKTTTEKARQGYSERHCDTLYRYGVGSAFPRPGRRSNTTPSATPTRTRAATTTNATQIATMTATATATRSLSRPTSVDVVKRRRGNEAFSQSRPTSAVERYGQQRMVQVVSGMR